MDCVCACIKKIESLQRHVNPVPKNELFGQSKHSNPQDDDEVCPTLAQLCLSTVAMETRLLDTETLAYLPNEILDQLVGYLSAEHLTQLQPMLQQHGIQTTSAWRRHLSKLSRYDARRDTNHFILGEEWSTPKHKYYSALLQDLLSYVDTIVTPSSGLTCQTCHLRDSVLICLQELSSLTLIPTYLSRLLSIDYVRVTRIIHTNIINLKITGPLQFTNENQLVGNFFEDLHKSRTLKSISLHQSWANLIMQRSIKCVSQLDGQSKNSTDNYIHVNNSHKEGNNDTVSGTGYTVNPCDDGNFCDNLSASNHSQELDLYDHALQTLDTEDKSTNSGTNCVKIITDYECCTSVLDLDKRQEGCVELTMVNTDKRQEGCVELTMVNTDKRQEGCVELTMVNTDKRQEGCVELTMVNTDKRQEGCVELTMVNTDKRQEGCVELTMVNTDKRQEGCVELTMVNTDKRQEGCVELTMGNTDKRQEGCVELTMVNTDKRQEGCVELTMVNTDKRQEGCVELTMVNTDKRQEGGVELTMVNSNLDKRQEGGVELTMVNSVLSRLECVEWTLGFFPEKKGLFPEKKQIDEHSSTFLPSCTALRRLNVTLTRGQVDCILEDVIQRVRVRQLTHLCIIALSDDLSIKVFEPIINTLFDTYRIPPCTSYQQQKSEVRPGSSANRMETVQPMKYLRLETRDEIVFTGYMPEYELHSVVSLNIQSCNYDIMAVEHLEIISCYLNRRNTHNLLQLCRHNKALTRLCIQSIKLTSQESSPLRTSHESSPLRTSHEFPPWRTSQDTEVELSPLRTILDFIIEDKQLELLDLQLMDLQECPDVIPAISNCIYQLSSLNHLNLSYCELGQQFLTDELIQGIQDHGTLETLDLSGNSLGSSGIKLLKAVLSSSDKKNLRKLLLSYCNLKGEDLLTVVRQNCYHGGTTRSNPRECLYYLDISNHVNREQQTMLRQLLVHRVKHLKLDYVDNPLADFAAQM